MATSTLDPGLNPRKDRQLGTGHGTDALGPSDHLRQLQLLDRANAALGKP